MGSDDIEVKRMYDAEERRKLAGSGDALPDGSFPIKDEADLKNAIAAFGRAKDKGAAKAHIIRRASDLGREDMIPQDWSAQDMSKPEEKAAAAMPKRPGIVDPLLGEDEPSDEMAPRKKGSMPTESEDATDEMAPDEEEDGLAVPKRKKKPADDVESDDEDATEDGEQDDKFLFRMFRRRMMKSDSAADEQDEKGVVKIAADGTVAKCAKGLAPADCGYKAGSPVCGKCGAMAVQTKDDDVEDLEVEVVRFDVADEDERAFLRKHHLAELGTKSADIEDGAFICMMEQKTLEGGTAPCVDCTGACTRTAGLPDLAEVEAVAEALYGKVLDSGYSDAADRFLVTVERKDGLFEAHFDGRGAFQALVRLPEEWLADEPVVTAEEAVKSAIAKVEGKALSIDAAVLEGYEVYSVEVDGADGKSYDVYVDPVSGDVLAYDAYELSADEVDVKSAEDASFLAALMEFELLEVEQDLPQLDQP